eukprot:TRINITY_DN78775_c0_g1_i1.p1 TRINITY_DN78775_c0_g1~~TRINITY_DN78775_c0_g1_i1.p1  ORF type:complete len:982 (+),score=244.37 TRINITY_DN78775_c0_g1_i1:113-2947(+)
MALVASLLVLSVSGQGIATYGSSSAQIIIAPLTGNTLNITFICNCNGYISFGWAPSTTTSAHSNADMIVGWVNSAGNGILLDTYSNSFSTPTLDTTKSVTLVKSSSTGGVTRIEFTRTQTTTDANQDVPISASGNFLQYAYSNTQISSTTVFPKHTVAASVGNVKLMDYKTTNSGTTGGGTTLGTDPPAPQAASGAQGLKSSDGKFSLLPQRNTDTITFTMTWSGASTSYLALAISPDPSANGLKAHSQSDVYIAYTDTAGNAFVLDAYSNSASGSTGASALVYDTVQNVNLSQPATTVNGVTTIVFWRFLDTGDTAQDKVIKDELAWVGWAVGTGNQAQSGAGYVNAMTIHDLGTAGCNGVEMNLFTGQVVAAGTLNPGSQLAITSVVFISFYAIVRYGYMAFKVYNSRKALQNAGPKPSAPPENDNDLLNATGKFYYQGSVAHAYKNELQEGAQMAAAAAAQTDASTGFQTVDLGGRDSSMVSVSEPQKQVGSKWSTMGHKITHFRLPRSQISLGDFLLAFAYFLVNIGFAAWWPARGYSAGKIWGYLATANSFFVALPATRNSVLVWLLGIPFDKTIMFHRWLGWWILIQTTVHWGYYGPTAATYGKVYWTGFGGWLFLMVLVGTSLPWVRRRHFNYFFYSHFIFFFYYLITCYHAVQFVPFTYAALAFYGLDRVLRLFWGAWPTKTVRIEVIGNAVRVTFKKHCAGRYKVGQYVFLNFPSIEFLEWHPFTLANGPDEEHLEVLIKGLGDHTKKMIAAAQASQQVWIRVDGPYGKWPFNFTRFKGVVLVAGGVGVTPSMALIRHVFNINRNGADVDTRLTDVFFVWSAKNEREFEWYQEMLVEAMKRSALKSDKYPTLHVYAHITQPSGEGFALPEFVRSGRPNLDEVFSRVDQLAAPAEQLRVAVVACGPALMVNDAWDQTVKRTGGNRRFDFHHETFEF